MKRHIVLLGPPGSGKDSQGKRLCAYLGVPIISTGEALRDEIARETGLGIRFKEVISQGRLVPDTDMYELIDELFERNNIANGFILNGFPRTVPQAEFLDKFLSDKKMKLDIALNLFVSEEEILRRISGRRTCTICGEVYNIYYSAPSQEGICDKCGGKLSQREDDKESSVKTRLSVYNDLTYPLYEYYRIKCLLVDINGEGKFGDVFCRIIGVVDD